MTKGTLIEKTTYDLGLAIQANLPTCGIPLKVQEYFLQHKDLIPEVLFRGFLQTLLTDFLGIRSFVVTDWEKLLEEEKISQLGPDKFSLLADLGVIIVPADYDHSKCLANFRKSNYEKFYGYNDDITDANFLNPSRILKPGDKLWVRAFQQIVKETTTSEERMAFLKEQNPIFTGAQGAALVFEQKRDQLPKGKWYASFDEKERLWKDADGYHRVPELDVHSDGAFFWNLGYFEDDWYVHHALLCFCDVPSGA